MPKILGAPKQFRQAISGTVKTASVRLAYMNTWHERLKRARLARGHANLSTFARALRVSVPTAHDWESGKTKELKGNNLINVCRLLVVHPDWLLAGKGGMDDVLRVVQNGSGAESLPLPAPSTSTGLPQPNQAALEFFRDNALSPKSKAQLEEINEAAQQGKLTEDDIDLAFTFLQRIKR